MSESKSDRLLKLVGALLAEKDGVAAKEKELVASLNAAVNKMGYAVVATGTGARRRRGRPPGRKPGRKASGKVGRRPGRPPESPGTA